MIARNRATRGNQHCQVLELSRAHVSIPHAQPIPKQHAPPPPPTTSSSQTLSVHRHATLPHKLASTRLASCTSRVHSPPSSDGPLSPLSSSPAHGRARPSSSSASRQKRAACPRRALAHEAGLLVLTVIIERGPSRH